MHEKPSITTVSKVPVARRSSPYFSDFFGSLLSLLRGFLRQLPNGVESALYLVSRVIEGEAEPHESALLEKTEDFDGTDGIEVSVPGTDGSFVQEAADFRRSVSFERERDGGGPAGTVKDGPWTVTPGMFRSPS